MACGKVNSGKATQRSTGKTPVGVAAPLSPVMKHKTHVKITGYAVITLFPFVAVALLEGILRLSGYGFCPDVVVQCEINNEKVFHCNGKFGWRFFSPRIARAFPPFTFPVKKGVSTCRIFVVGSSAAMGDPEPAFSFWRMIYVQLSARYPNVKFEVIPVAMAAINSPVCREIVRECARYEPDLFVIYMGNNEAVGPYGPGTVFTPVFGIRSLVRLSIALRSMRIGQLGAAILSSSGRSFHGKTWEGLEMFLDNPVRAGDPRLSAVYRNFGNNLKAMRHDALRGGAAVMLCTVGSNLKDNSPFGSLHRPGMSREELGRWNDSYKKGRVCEDSGQTDSALAWYRLALALDSSYAELQFCVGHCFLQKGDSSQAARRYGFARDLDVFRFRADDSINAIIRSVAAMPCGKGRVMFCDAKTLFDSASPGRIAGQEMFLEHAHMTFEGNHVLAGAVCTQMQAVLPEWIRNSAIQRGTLLTEQECRTRMAYSEWERYEILKRLLDTRISRLPYTRQLGNETRRRALASEVQALAAQLTPDALQGIDSSLQETVAMHPDDPWLHWRYARFLSIGLNDQNRAGEHYRIVLEHFPRYADVYAALAETYGMRNDMDGTIMYARKALHYAPYNVYARYNLGFALMCQKKNDKAVRQLQIAIECEPFFESAYINLGLCFAFQGKLDDAAVAYRNGLRYKPESEDLRLGLAGVLLLQKHMDDARREIDTALRYNPQSVRARNLLQSVSGTPRTIE
jgi:tetratricopeptide (TPR) repeat protein